MKFQIHYLFWIYQNLVHLSYILRCRRKSKMHEILEDLQYKYTRNLKKL